MANRLETMETVRDFLFLGKKIIADGDFNIKRHLLLGRKAMTNLESILKSREITLLTKFHKVPNCNNNNLNLGQIMNSNVQKDKNPTATSEVLGAIPAHSASGWANHLSHPSGLIHRSIPNLTPSSSHLRDGLSHPQGARRRTYYWIMLPRAAPKVTVKPWLNFSSGLLSMSIDQRVQNQDQCTTTKTQLSQIN